MALIAVAADKGAPGVTTAAVALAAVWPRPVLLAECDPAGGDLVYRLPRADGGQLDPRRGLLSLAVAARRGLQPHQVWEHAQKLHGGLDILTGVRGAEQGAGLELLWGSVGRLLAAVPQADVIADCGRIGVDGPLYDLLAQASTVVLLTGVSLGEVIRLRDRVSAVAAALLKRGRSTGRIDVVVVTDYKNFGSASAEVGQALQRTGAPVRVLGGLAYEPKSADQLRGRWSGKLDKSMFIRTARAIAADLVAALPAPSSGQPPTGQSQSASGPSGQPGPAPQRPAPHAPIASAPLSPGPSVPGSAVPGSAVPGSAAAGSTSPGPVPYGPVPPAPPRYSPAAAPGTPDGPSSRSRHHAGEPDGNDQPGRGDRDPRQAAPRGR